MNKAKILLTGAPRSGKSTLIEKIIQAIPDKQGFITKEVLSENGRVGFDVVTASGKKEVLARIGLETGHKVSKYSVDVEKFEALLPELFNYGSETLLYLDEIGEMELLSDGFKKLAGAYLDSGNPFIGTLTKVYTDEFVEDLKHREDVVCYEITPQSRSEIEALITRALLE